MRIRKDYTIARGNSVDGLVVILADLWISNYLIRIMFDICGRFDAKIHPADDRLLTQARWIRERLKRNDVLF